MGSRVTRDGGKAWTGNSEYSSMGISSKGAVPTLSRIPFFIGLVSRDVSSAKGVPLAS